MEPDDELPRAGYEFPDGGLDLTEGAPVPRVGEFMQIVTGETTKHYVVLAVNTRLFLLHGQPPGWLSYVTLGPGSQVKDQRLLAIRE
jgi:hypothetical protein